MAKKTATIILNRNLKTVVEAAVDRFNNFDGNDTDVFVVESGSEEANLPRCKHWWANWPEAMADGLRFPRGFNFGLSQLVKEKIYDQYDYFFLVCNDVELPNAAVVKRLVDEMEKHPSLGILSPLSPEWGEKRLIPPGETRYFWYIETNAWLLKREFVDSIREKSNPDHMNFLYDGTNFRGYGCESELIAKAYANQWSAGITSAVMMSENRNLLIDRAQLIKTNPWEESLTLAESEGRAWMKRKYGFNSRWLMQMYVKLFYDKFFEFYPGNERYRIK